MIWDDRNDNLFAASLALVMFRFIIKIVNTFSTVLISCDTTRSFIVEQDSSPLVHQTHRLEPVGLS